MRIQDQYPSIRIRSVWLILVVGCLLLQSCGGASPESDTDVSATVLENSDSLRYTLAANATADSPTGLQVIAITKLSATKVSRTIYDYVFKVSIENSGEARTGVKASLIQAGKGSNIVDAEATIRNMGAKSFARSNDTITIRHDRTLAFDLTALKWVVASSRLESINETTLATVGVSDIQMINSTGRITMAAGGSERVGLHYNLAQGVIDSDIVWSVHADTKNVFKVIKGDSSLDITVNGSGLRDGDSAPLTLKVVRASTGQFAFYELSAAVVAADDQKTVRVSSQGAKVVTPLGDVTFSSNQLSTPVQATVTTVNLPGGGSRTQIRFDRAVENAGIRVKLPKVVNGDPATSAVTVQSAPRQALAAQRHSEIAAADTQCGVVQTTNGDYVKDGSGDKLGPQLFSRYAMFRGVTRIDNEEIALASTSGAGSTSVGGEISYTFDKAASGTLEAAISATSLETCSNDRLLSLVDWTSKEPVLFVHGFTAAKLFGGGQGTWVNFPKLAVRAFGMTPGLENPLVPFEFRWATDSDFKTAARDLGQIINYIYNRTGRRVHIVAHSFGGVLARTLLQDLAPDNTDSLGVGKMADAKAHVASLVTLGSPYSGIFANDTQVTLSSGTLNVPKGRDDWTLIGNCGQISCYQMGQDNAAFAGLGYVGDSARLGALTVQLAQTSNRLPNIPIHVGIGLTASAGRFGIGDDLISFAGQRFINPQTFDGAISAPLLDRTKVGAATVTETVLSGNASTRPGTAQQNSVDTTARPRGYAHTALTVSDGGSTFGYGLEAAPEYGCGGVVTCTHAGYRLFQEMIADAIRLSRPDAANTAAADPAKLVLNPAKLAQIDPSQIDALLPEMQAMLDAVRPYAQGSRIAWESIGNDQRLTDYKVILTRAFTNNNDAKLDQLFTNRLAEMDTLSQFRAKAFADANSIFDPSPENIKLLADIVINSVKGGYAAARILVPAVNVTNAIAGPVKFASLQKHAEIVGKWKVMSGMVEFTDFMGGCGAASIQLLTTSLDTTPENLAGSDLANSLVSATKCVLTAIGDGASGVPGRGRVIAKFFSATIDYNGSTVSTWATLSGIISALAEAVPPPPIPAISFVGAVADFINAAATAIQAGGEMAENTNRAATMKRFEIEAVLDEVEKSMRARQLRALVAVRAESLFIISKQLPTVTATPSTLSAWDTAVWKVSGVWQTVKSVVWNFGSGVGDYLTTAATKLVAAVVGGVSDAVEYVFQTAGSKTVTITYKDSANGGGNVVGFSSVNAEVAANPSVAIAAVITSVKTASGVEIPEAGSTSEQRPKLSGTLSAPISNYFSVWVYLDDVRLAPATVDGTSWAYTATSDIPVGAHKFTVAVVRFDSVEGAKSAPRSLTVVGSDANTGLIAHFPFDGSLADRVRPGAVGLLVAQKTPPVFESGSNGQAVQLTPPNALAGSYLRGTALVTTDTSFTIAATVKPNGIAANGVNALIFQRTDLGGDAQGCSGNAYNFGLMIYAGRWLFMVSTLQDGRCIHANIYGQETPVVGRYYKVAGVYDKAASKARLYIDGALVGEQAVGNSFRITPNMVATIGNQPWASPAQPANASIDDLKVYSRALAPAELSSPSLVGYWSFDNCNAADDSGSGGNGQLVGSPVCEQGVAGSGMRLNSTNWIDVPSRPGLEFTTNFTISVWFKADALTNERSVRLVDKVSAGSGDGYLLSVWASGLSLGGGPHGANSDLTPISNNAFHHAVVTFGNGIASFYLDGMPIGSRSVGAMSMTVNADRVLRIGGAQGPAARPTFNNFVGVIDEVRLYNTALASSEVSGLYQATSNSVKLNTANGHRYEVVDCGTWAQCRDAAVAKGGKLVTIRSQAENDWVFANIIPLASSDLGAWIGFSDAGHEGLWYWASGETPGFTRWNQGEPNNWQGVENYAHMYKDGPSAGYWNDFILNPVQITQAVVEYINGSTITLNASQFSTGTNIAVNDDATHPCRHGLVYNAPPYYGRPNSGEWVVVAPTAGSYSMAVTFAALESRPVDILINGASALKGVLSKTTGGWCAVIV